MTGGWEVRGGGKKIQFQKLIEKVFEKRKRKGGRDNCDVNVDVFVKCKHKMTNVCWKTNKGETRKRQSEREKARARQKKKRKDNVTYRRNDSRCMHEHANASFLLPDDASLSGALHTEHETWKTNNKIKTSK